MVKINDLQQPRYQKNNIDLIAIVARVGVLKLAPHNKENGKSLIAAREIFLYDDSWTMIKLVVRDQKVKTCNMFKTDAIIFLKNVKAMKVRNNIIVLATINETLMGLDNSSPESLNLRAWHTTNMKNLSQTACEKVMLNLSVSMESSESRTQNSTSLPTENIPIVHQQFINMSNNNTNENMNNDGNIQVKRKIAIESQDGGSLFKCKCLEQEPIQKAQENFGMSQQNVERLQVNWQEIEESLVQNGLLLNSQASFSSKTQPTASTSESMKCNTQKESMISSTEESLKEDPTETQSTKNTDMDAEKKVESNEGIEKIVNENGADDLVKETFDALMTFNPLEDEWNERKDQHLINFVIKNLHRLNNDLLYEDLLKEKPNVFKNKTVQMLKFRVLELTNVKNYLYFLKLCGGYTLKTEDEKCIFIDQIEKIRKSIQFLKAEKSVD